MRRNSENEKRNITLSLPAELVRSARIVAIQRGKSLSSLVAEALTEIVERGQDYERARRLELAILSEGLALGTRGRATWTRAELHER